MPLSGIFKRVLEIIKKLTNSKYWPWVVIAIFILVVLINGIDNIPGRVYQLISATPFTSRTDIDPDNYWQNDILLPVIGYFLHMTGRMTFSILCVMILVIAYSLFTVWVYKKYGSLPAFIFSPLLFTNPLTTILLSWLGSPDGLTFLLTIPFLFSNSIYLLIFLSFIGTLNHVTFPIAALEILILRFLSNQRIKIQHLLGSLAAIVMGFIALRLFATVNQLQPQSRLEYIQNLGVSHFLEMNLSNLPITLASLFNIQWLIILVCLVMFLKMDKRFYLTTLLMLLINYGITFFTLDTTRIFSILSWGVLFSCIFHSYELAKKQGENVVHEYLLAIIVVVIASFIAPRFFSWGGTIHTTPFFSFLTRIF